LATNKRCNAPTPSVNGAAIVQQMQSEPYAKSHTISVTCSLVHRHFQAYKGFFGSLIKKPMGHSITTSALDKYTIGQMQQEPYA